MSENPSRWDVNVPQRNKNPETIEKTDQLGAAGKGLFSKVKKFIDKLEDEQLALHHYKQITMDNAFNVVLRAGAKLGFTVVNADKASGTVNFQTNSGERRWDGTISVILITEGDGVEILTSSRTDKGGIYNPMGISASAAEGARAIKEAQLLQKIKTEMIENQKKSGTYVEIKICRYCKVQYFAEECLNCFPESEKVNENRALDSSSRTQLSGPTSVTEMSDQNLKPEYKTCPMCAEEIKFAAKKCRFCQHMLDD